MGAPWRLKPLPSAMTSITCEAKVHYRHSLRATSRFRQQATLELGRDGAPSVPSPRLTSERGVYWLHVGPQRSRRTSFKVRGNVAKLFTQELAQGKACIEVRLPAVYVYVRQADAHALRHFLHLLEELVLDPAFGAPLSACPRYPHSRRAR